MISIEGYSITAQLKQTDTTAVYRGIRIADRVPIICKVLTCDYGSAKERASFRREFEICAKLNGEGTVKVHALETLNSGLAIIMEDFGGVSLDHDDSITDADLGDKLLLAAHITEALAKIHHKKIIHKDINPSNILRNPETGMVKIIDFGISAELPRETIPLPGAGVVEGDLSYISPEQTGRMNRPIDCRSDLYSLGITLYELFTGQLPFKGQDDLELVYCHIAKNAVPARTVNPMIPETLSDIIGKLLSKSVDSRYQSAEGLLTDLNRCLEQMDRTGTIGHFTIGETDYAESFSIPHKLYGRENEIATLLETYQEVCEGTMQLLMVAGTPGVGKTALIQEIHKSVSSGKAFFISGKFNLLERNLPYSALIQAFRELAGQLLCLPAEFLEARKSDLVSALSIDPGVLLNIVPELKSLFGPVEPPLPLDPIAAQNRIQRVWRNFIASIAAKDHPFILFLDDVQWGDQSTIDFLRYLFSQNAIPYVFVICAYRDTEVSIAHPVSLMLKTLSDQSVQGEVAYRSIFLKALGIGAIEELLADTLRSTEDSTRELASALFRKTEGNPFFTIQMLNQLNAEGTFAYDRAENRWRWDLKKVIDAGLSDNVIDFLVARLKTLPEKTLALLKIAACLGYTFDLKTVSAVQGQRVDVPGSGLWDAIEQEIIIPRNSDYRLLNLQSEDSDHAIPDLSFKFQHDRLHQAILSLITERDRIAIHHCIGMEMRKDAQKAESPESFLEIVNHLNLGRALAISAEARTELADLNFEAGKRAMSVTAFRAAAEYFEIALSLLSDEEWVKRPDIAFELSLERANSVFLSGDSKEAFLLVDNARALAAGDLQQASVSILKSKILEFQGDLYGAVDEIRRSLAVLGLVLPENPEEIQKNIGQGLGRLQEGLARTPIDRLPFLDEVTDEKHRMAMRLLSQVVPSAIQFNYTLYLTATLMMMDLTLRYGITAESCKCVADAGIIVSAMLGDYETGYRLGRAAFALIDKLKADWQRPAVSFSFTYVSHMRKHYQEALDYYDLSWRSGMEMGDLQHAAYARAHKIHLMMWVGSDLQACERETISAIAFLKESQGFIQLKLAEMVHHFIRKLRTLPGAPEETELAKAEVSMIADIHETKHMVMLVRFSQYNAFYHFIMGEQEEAEQWNATAESIIFASGTDFPVADHYVIQALLLVDKIKRGMTEGREAAFDTIRANIAILKKFSDNSPENFSHKYLLLSAELSDASGDPVEKTLELFRHARTSIGKNDFTQMRALIAEREGLYWIARGEEILGKAFLREAYYLWSLWGASRKLAVMEREYPFNFQSGDTCSVVFKKPIPSTQSVSNKDLDINSITKSMQVISREIKTENLLKILMGILIENAGAEKGCFLLAHDGMSELSVEAIKGADSDSVEIVSALPQSQCANLCQEIVKYVERTRESVVLDDAAITGKFTANDYIRDGHIKSVLCMPMISHNAMQGVVYLENNLSNHVFTAERLTVLKILASQAAISIENAHLYETMEKKVRERTEQLNEANEKLHEMTLIDPLTRLNNRRFFIHYITGTTERYIKNITRSYSKSENRVMAPLDSVIGVFLIDIDFFKEVNDTWGHAAGDSVLVSISKTLSSIIRGDDYIVRWGGEEFLIILNNTAPSYLSNFAVKALSAVKASSVTLDDGTTIKRTCSIGFAQVPFNRTIPDFLTLDQTINLSDYAMYIAKRNGRNRAVSISLKTDFAANDAFKDCLLCLSKNTDSINDGIILEETLG